MGFHCTGITLRRKTPDISNLHCLLWYANTTYETPVHEYKQIRQNGIYDTAFLLSCSVPEREWLLDEEGGRQMAPLAASVISVPYHRGKNWCYKPGNMLSVQYHLPGTAESP